MSVLVTVLIMLVFGVLVFFGVRSLRKERKKARFASATAIAAPEKSVPHRSQLYGIQQKGEPK